MDVSAYDHLARKVRVRWNNAEMPEVRQHRATAQHGHPSMWLPDVREQLAAPELEGVVSLPRANLPDRSSACRSAYVDVWTLPFKNFHWVYHILSGMFGS